jgi:hypothetical protein
LAKVEAELSLEEDLTVARNFADIDGEIDQAVAEIRAIADQSAATKRRSRKAEQAEAA